jgi:hypothetical protein
VDQNLAHVSTKALLFEAAARAQAPDFDAEGLYDELLRRMPKAAIDYPVTEAPTSHTITAPPSNRFSVTKIGGGLAVTFGAVAPNALDPAGVGPHGHIPTPADVVAVINAMAAASDQGRKDAIETRMGWVEAGLSRATSAVADMARNQKAMAQASVDNQTSFSQRLQAIEQALSLRNAEYGTTKMMWPPKPGDTAPPPSAEQVAAAERGAPQGGSVYAHPADHSIDQDGSGAPI